MWEKRSDFLQVALVVVFFLAWYIKKFFLLWITFLEQLEGSVRVCLHFCLISYVLIICCNACLIGSILETLFYLM